MIPVRNHGLLAEIPPAVLYYGSLWVLAADGIFSGMATQARFHHLGLSVLAGLAVVVILAAAALSRTASWLFCFALGIIYGFLAYAMSAIVLLTTVVTIQMGLMHLVAFAILRSHWREPFARRLRARLARSS